MKKVLILTYYWPPSGGAGVQRCLKFVKYLREFGWEPIVYTALDGEMPVMDKSLQKDVPKNITVLKTKIWEPYSIYKKFIGRKKTDKINASFLSENKKAGIAEKISVWIRGNYFIPDARKYWIKPSVDFVTDYARKYGIKHIISSGPPHTMHMIGLGVKQRVPDIKWIADFRDPWTNIDFYEKLMLSKKADAKHHEMEMSVLQNAGIVLSVGKTMSEEFKAMYTNAGGKSPEKFRVITNGFDEADLKQGTVIKDTKFSIAHIGTLVKDRNPEVLWQVLSKLVKTNSEFEKELEIKLVGKLDFFVKQRIDFFGLTKYINKIEYMPHSEVIEEQQRSRVLLLLVNNTKNAKGILTGKVFEYMASNVPILAIGPTDGDLAEIISEAGCGLISGFTDGETLEQNILQLFNNSVMPANANVIQKYSRKNLTRELAGCLASL
ncbi:MAG: glycosyltransferase [Bacteroidetes bacterium]|nr:glycosyltransferase [Bacteroidota bacterium]